MPYTGVRPDAIDNPCFPRTTCGATYGFTNQLSLTNDTSIFADRVRSTPIAANQDGPEGGLDALLQAMVCTVSVLYNSNCLLRFCIMRTQLQNKNRQLI